MSQYVPGTLYGAERDMDMALQERLKWAQSRRLRRQCKKQHNTAQRFPLGVWASLRLRFAARGKQLQERYNGDSSAQAAQSV